MAEQPTAVLPPPRERPYRVGLVCLGNICRSPMAAAVLDRKLRDAGLADRVEVSSAGTGDWHVGEPMDRRAAATLVAAGYDSGGHRAQQVSPGWLDRDLLLTMDATNRADVLALRVAPERVLPFRAFDPAAGDCADDLEVPDPWYGGPDGFEGVLTIVERTSGSLAHALSDLLG
ncbi:MAG: low molecular weight protein-tyrosine-phosphatase [Marmoricola sp.]